MVIVVVASLMFAVAIAVVYDLIKYRRATRNHTSQIYEKKRSPGHFLYSCLFVKQNKTIWVEE